MGDNHGVASPKARDVLNTIRIELEQKSGVNSAEIPNLQNAESVQVVPAAATRTTTTAQFSLLTKFLSHVPLLKRISSVKDYRIQKFAKAIEAGYKDIDATVSPLTFMNINNAKTAKVKLWGDAANNIKQIKGEADKIINDILNDIENSPEGVELSPEAGKNLTKQLKDMQGMIKVLDNRSQNTISTSKRIKIYKQIKRLKEEVDKAKIDYNNYKGTQGKAQQAALSSQFERVKEPPPQPKVMTEQPKVMTERLRALMINIRGGD